MRNYAKKHQKEVVDQQIETIDYDVNTSKASKILITIISILFILILISGFTGFMSGLMLPVVGVLFMVGGFLSGLVVEKSISKVFKDFLIGMSNLLPGVILILMLCR